jgi:hypothetical protein
MPSRSNPTTDADFFNLRKEGKIFISKAFKFSQDAKEESRNVVMVFENSDIVLAGEINGVLTLRQSPKKKQQVAVLISQDDKKIKRLTLQRFDERKSGVVSTGEHSFSFRGDEFSKLIAFLKAIQFIDFSNTGNFQIEDLSTNTGNKALIDSSEKNIIKILKSVNGEERINLLQKIRNDLTKKDIDILLGRKDALEIFKYHIAKEDWSEKDWQQFFNEQKWIFGYGLDYRILSQFDRDMNVSSTGTDNKEKATVDFLMTFTDFTATVEIKKPATQIFDKTKNRSGAWGFHTDFIGAISQVLEQKAEWHILGQQNNLYNKEGNEKLEKRTRDAKAILLIGNKAEFVNLENKREKEIKQDTFELFRRGSRNIEVITYDELLERANFIVNQ